MALIAPSTCRSPSASAGRPLWPSWAPSSACSKVRPAAHPAARYTHRPAAHPLPARLPSAGHVDFAPGACERLEPYITSRVVGQELAVRQLADAVCDHLALPDRHRPLVLSLHGPQGVGKSMSHHLLAEALYNAQPRRGLACPGADCAGYKARWSGSAGLGICRCLRAAPLHQAAPDCGAPTCPRPPSAADAEMRTA